MDRFAEECVRSGRFASISEVHRAAMRLLQEVEQQRMAFIASLDAAIEEGRRDGFLTVEQVEAGMLAEIEAMEAARKQNDD